MRKGLQKKVFLLLGIFLALSLSSCGYLAREQTQRQMGHAAMQAQIELDTGKFQKAIDIQKEIYQKYPQDPTVRSGYIKTLESIKSSGDRASERNDFALAGNIYEILAKNWSHFSDFSQSLSFNRNFLEKKVRTSRCLYVEKQVRAYLETGDFKKVLDIQEFFQKYSQDFTVQNGYIKTLESLKDRADQAFERNDFALAGCIYELLLKHISFATPLGRHLSLDREILTKKIRSCKKILFENGLEQYRSGDLSRAISIWKSILAFDPENQEIKRTVDTTILQSKNLEKTK